MSNIAPLSYQDAKHLCEKSAERLVQAAPVTARLIDWFLGEVAS